MSSQDASLDALVQLGAEIVASEHQRLVDMYVLLHRAQLLVKREGDEPATFLRPDEPSSSRSPS